MELFTIQFLDKLLIENKIITNLQSQSELAFYDCCNWLIGVIVRKNIALDADYGNFVNIHSSTLKRVIGRNYKQKIKALEQMNIIHVNHHYSGDRFSKSFSLTEAAIKLGIVKRAILSRRFSNSLQNYMQDRFNKIYSNPLNRKLLDNLSRLRMKGEFDDYVLNVLDTPSRNQFRIQRYDVYFNSIYQFDKNTKAEYVFNTPIAFEPSISRHGRLYHPGASIPKFIRRLLSTDKDEPLYEIDMSSAQLSLLMLHWLSIHLYVGEESKDFQEEYDLCKSLVLSGGIYQYINDHSIYCNKKNYSDLKLEILSTLNAKFYPSEMNKILQRLFPNFMSYINHLKRKSGNQKVSQIGHSLEALIFVEVYKEIDPKVFSLIIHDCILTTEHYTLQIKEMLENRVKEVFPDILANTDSMPGLFKISRVSFTDDEFSKNQFQYYINSIEEDLEMLGRRDSDEFIGLHSS